MKPFRLALSLTSLTLIAACGGGGGGTTAAPTPPTATSFPLQSAYKSFVANGFAKTFTVSGSCTGTGNAVRSGASTATTFEGAPAFSATTTLTATFTNCTPASLAQSIVNYFDSNYLPRGYNSPGGDYAVYTTPAVIPATVSIGSTAIIGKQTTYASSAKTSVTGTSEESFVVESDTASTATAIVNVISKDFNAAGTLTSTGQDRYRIDAAGTLTPVSFEIQYSNGSSTRLIFTF